MYERKGKKHIFIPDTQIHPGAPINHLYWASQYILDKGPDTIIFAGDWWDFPSLSAWDKPGSKRAETQRLRRDIDAGRFAMDVMLRPWERNGWAPRKIFLMGNHEHRYSRMVEEQPRILDGLLADPFGLKDRDFEVYDFLRPVMVDGVRYAHFFPHNAKGGVTQTKAGSPSARAQVQRQMCSATAGHQQGLDVAVLPTPDGMQRGLISGSFYLHNEAYMGPLNHYWRGLILKHDVRGGDYSLCEVDMNFLSRKYRRTEPPGRKTA